MELNQLLAIVKELGLTLKLNKDGQPCIDGPRENILPSLMTVLKIHREELRVYLADHRTREWRRENDDRAFKELYPEHWPPLHARYWRYEGETEWRPIPEALIQATLKSWLDSVACAKSRGGLIPQLPGRRFARSTKRGKNGTGPYLFSLDEMAG